jgi:hypothetical protein
MGDLVREDSTREGRKIWKLVEEVAAAAPKDAALQSDHLKIDELARTPSAQERRPVKRGRGR